MKDKVLAAHRAGMKQVIVPNKNEKDLHEIPENVRVSILPIKLSTNIGS